MKYLKFIGYAVMFIFGLNICIKGRAYMYGANIEGAWAYFLGVGSILASLVYVFAELKNRR